MTGFAELPELVLAPLAGRPEADWYRAPPGKWSPAQVVHHLALSLDTSGRTFESRRTHAPMRRRPRTARQLAAYYLVMYAGWALPGFEAPAGVRPAERPGRDAVERQLRDGVERFGRLERELLPVRRADLFVKHPALGDLTFPEWIRFHLWHCAHHVKQIRARLAS
ncbi:MAG TPA: DinB family protein [Gemmatimonadales bacterium]|nr:DinB family protein [Gemmatimonadales bacterium]HYT84684.1 DinB family protein [Gemmatimonadales bacterium]